MKNKGFSFVELILVIAILGILTAVAGISIGLVFRTNVNSTVDKLDSSFSKAKTEAMAKGRLNGQLVLKTVDNDIYCYVGNVSNPNMDSEMKKIADNPVKIAVVTTTGTTYILGSGNASVTFNYRDSSGAFDYIQGTSTYCEYIKVYKDDKVAYLDMVTETGKQSIRK